MAVHDNGRKHKEAVEANLHKRRGDKLEEERQQKEMESSLLVSNARLGRRWGRISRVVPSARLMV